MNMFKKNGGFTLVELIVVIAILAILAGVAVPAYSGYIKEANKAGDLTALNAIQTAVNAVFATEEDLPDTITVVEGSSVTVVATVGSDSYDMHDASEVIGEHKIGEEFALLYGNDLSKLDLKSGDKAVWSRTTSDWDITDTTNTTN